MFIHNIDPVFLRLGPLEVRYYGLAYALGFILAYFFLRWWAGKGKVKNFKPEQVEDYLLYAIIGIVSGARMFYILFYNLSYYIQNPLNIFAVWQGGLSFHGGLFGIVFATYVYCKHHKVPFLQLADAASIPAAIGLFFGRITNFINGELYGRVTSLPWCVQFKGAEGCRHPSQIYEALKNLFIFTVLWKIKDKRHKDGTIFFTFVMLYSFLRFFIEFVREPDPQLGFMAFGLTMGQILNIIMFAVGAYFMWRINKK